MHYPILLLCSILLAIGNNLLLHGFRNRGLRGMGDVLFFNAAVSAIWIVILLPVQGFSPISVASFGWGAAYGTVTAVFLLCKMQAMSTGPVSVTSFVGCSSLLVSTAFGILFFREKITVLQLVGVALLLCALFLTVSPKASGAQKGWKLWCGLFFLCAGGVGIVFKLFGASADAQNVDSMMLCAATVSCVLFLAVGGLLSRKQQGTAPRLPKNALPFLLGCGLVSCIYNRLNISLSAALPSIVFFPVFNGAVILGASLLASLLFREKLQKQQLLGLALGSAALLLAAGVIDGILKLM